jgi:biopolymer transport protein ExbD
MRSRALRRASPIAELDVTAFINLMVVLVAFFLSSVAYFQFSSLDLKIPPAAEGAANPGTALNLEIIIRNDALEVGDRNAGLMRRFDNKAGDYDFKGLNEMLRQIKARFTDKTDATILVEPNIPYDILIKTMDATRTFVITTADKATQYELFPDLSIGDAPGAPSVRATP